EDDALLFADAEQRRQLSALHMDVGGKDSGLRGIELRMLAELADLAGVGSLQMSVLLLQTAIALRLVIAQVAMRSGVGHQQELDAIAVAVGQAQEGRVGSKIESAAGDRLTGLVGERGSQVHDHLKGLAEILVVVVAGDGQEGASVAEEFAKR